MQVSIIGAGPSGSYAGMLLAKQGHNVTIYEDHAVIGQPVACTGIVTGELFSLVRKDRKFIVNELEGADIIGPGNSKARIKLREFVLCRRSFDGFLAEKARDAGAEIGLSHRFVSRNGNALLFRHKGGLVEKKADIIVGADGPLSAVAKSSGIACNRNFLVGMQATIKSEFNPEIFTAWFRKELAPGFFAWSVPESSKISRVGLAASPGSRCSDCFLRLMKLVGGKIIARQGAPIPVYNHQGIVEKGNVFLVGDAAGLVKDTTGGGIITGMLSSRILAESIESGTGYSAGLHRLRRELWIHSKLRRMLNRFTDKDYSRLITYMNRPSVQSILYRHPREYPSGFLLKLLLAEPRLALFAKHAFA